MIKLKVALCLLMLCQGTMAQVPDSTIILLQNNGILPLLHLDSLTIDYKENDVLRYYGERYTQNEGAVLLHVNALSSGEEPDNNLDILILLGDSVAVSEDMLNDYQAIIYSERGDSIALDRITQMMFGGRLFTGVLNKAIYGFEVGDGIFTKEQIRFAYGEPAEVNLDSAYLRAKLDSIALAAIDSGVAPGIQVLVARDGMVVYHETFGFQTYDSITPVRKDMLYDFASITKITGALPAIMQLYDQAKFDLDAKMGTYLPYFDRGNKKNLSYRRVLSHNAGLQAWIPFWTTTIKKNGKFKRHTLASDSTSEYTVKLTDSLYLYNRYRDNIYKQIKKSPLRNKTDYVYSGLSFYLYPEIIENLTGEDFETYLKKNIYKPLGASSITYNPLRYYPRDQMVPTEIDTFFRKTPLVGLVHDEGAAMMQGVSSNAGLFGTTIDLAKLMQMYLWKGSFGKQQFISSNTIEIFTACHYCNEGNRRGLAFDKPLLEDKANGSTALEASLHSFGHSGYTGTFTWADPDTGILFVFMSNRVYPTRNNSKIYQLNVRPAMHQVIYDARIDK